MKVKNILRLFLFLLLCSNFSQSMGQTYPVQVNVYVTPPYSNYLSDYYTSSNEKLVVTLLNRDMQKPNLEVRLRVKITSMNGLNIQSKETVVFPSISLDPGIPLRLSQEDIAFYLQAPNINASGLQQGLLPDGLTEFTFQAIERYTGQVVSAPATGRVWISTQKPPLLTLPINNENIAFTEPLNIRFQWTPQHQNLSQVEYEFDLRELPNNLTSAQTAYLYAPSIYSERLSYTTLQYQTALMYPLDPDKRYAWRVRAIAKDGVDELNLFSNNGYSEIQEFRFSRNCPPPLFCNALLEGRRLDLQWTPAENNTEFSVQFRAKHTSSSLWTEIKTQENNISIYALNRGETYEYRVGAICTSGEPVFGTVAEIQLPAVDSARLARCGISPELPLSNTEPLPELKVGDVVTIGGDFPMTVTQTAGSDGRFTGKGWIPIDWIFESKWAVEFSNLEINSDYRQMGGSVRTQYDTSGSQLANIDDITDGGIENSREGIINTMKVNFPIPPLPEPSFEYNENTGELIVYSTDGQQTGTIQLPKNENGIVVFPITLTDSEGNIYTIDTEKDEDGNVKTDENGEPIVNGTYVGKQGEALDANSFNREQIANNIGLVTFSKGNGKYAFDTYQNYYLKTKLKDEYDCMGESLYAPWKLLPEGCSDKVSLNIELKDKKADPAKVIFTTEQGTRYTTKALDQGGYELKLAAGVKGDVQEIYALYPKTEGASAYYTLGKLNVVTYQKQDVKLTVVQVTNNKVNSGQLKSKLDEIYDPIGISWQVETIDYSKVPEAKFFEKSGLLDAYNDAMKTWNADFISHAKEEGFYDPNTAYLFILDQSGVKNDRNTAGFMPRGKQFGYIFDGSITKKDDINQIIAHELGHGRWRLYHPFSKEYGEKIAQGSTDNLMDYSTGATHLAKWQWDQIANPAWFTSPFESDEEGMISQEETKTICISAKISQALSKKKYLYDPKGRAFQLPEGFSVERICYEDKSDQHPAKIGSAIVLLDKEEKRYISHKKNSSGEFLFYAIKNDTTKKLPINYTGETIIADIRIVEDSCKIYIDGLAYILGHAECPCYNTITYKSPYAISFWEKFGSLDSKEIQEQARLIASYMDEMNEEYIKELIEKSKYAYSVAGDNPSSWNYYFNSLWRAYAKNTEPNEEVLKTTLTKIRAYNDACINLSKRAEDTSSNKFTSSEEITNLVKELSFGDKVVAAESPFKQLTISQRLYLLKILSESTMPSRWTVGEYYKVEDIVLLILKTIPESQRREFYSEFKESSLISGLLEGMNGNNFYIMCDYILQGVVPLLNIPSQEINIKSYKDSYCYIEFNDAYLGKRNYERINDDGTLSVSAMSWLDAHDITILRNRDPYQVILVDFTYDTKIGEHVYKTQQSVELPIFYVYALFNKDTEQKIKQSIFFTLDVAALFVGVGEIKLAYSTANWIRMALAATDIAITTASATTYTLLEKEIEQRYPTFHENFWKVSTAWNITYIAGTSAAKAALKESEIQDLYRDAQQISRNTEETSEIRNFAESVSKRIEDQAQIDPKVKKIVDEVKVGGQLSQYVGKATKGIKNLLPLENPTGLFRQLKGKNGTYRAANFWKEEGNEIIQYISKDSKYYIKHDPTNGRMLFIDIDNNKFVGFALDEEKLITNDYEKLIGNLKTIHGLPGGAKSITIGSGIIHFSNDKVNLLFGKYKPNSVQGITGEIGTDDIIKELSILKNYSFADKSFELKNGSVHVLNIPDKMGEGVDFFDAYNKDILDLAVNNPRKVRVTLVSDPRKKELLFIVNNLGENIPTGFAKEIKYLRDHNIKIVYFRDGTTIDLDNINLNDINWNSWKY